MPEGVITTASNAQAIATIVGFVALPRLKAATVMYAISNTDYSPLLANYGQTINVPIPAEFSSNLLADGGTVTRQLTSLGNAALILNRHREITFEVTDLNQMLASPDIKQTNLGQAIANLAQDIDSDLLGVYTQFTLTAVGAYNTALTEAVIDAAETALFGQRVPAGTRKSLVVSPNGYSQIRQIPRFTEARTVGQDGGTAGMGSGSVRGGITGAGATGMAPSTMADGYVGRLKDMDVYRDQLVLITSGTNTHGLALAPLALLTAVRPMQAVGPGKGVVQVMLAEDNIAIRLTMGYHQEVLGEMMTIDVLFGFVAGRTNFGVEVKH